jgi:hypothetical protein
LREKIELDAKRKRDLLQRTEPLKKIQVDSGIKQDNHGGHQQMKQQEIIMESEPIKTKNSILKHTEDKIDKDAPRKLINVEEIVRIEKTKLSIIYNKSLFDGGDAKPMEFMRMLKECDKITGKFEFKAIHKFGEMDPSCKRCIFLIYLPIGRRIISDRNSDLDMLELWKLNENSIKHRIVSISVLAKEMDLAAPTFHFKAVVSDQPPVSYVFNPSEIDELKAVLKSLE